MKAVENQFTHPIPGWRKNKLQPALGQKTHRHVHHHHHNSCTNYPHCSHCELTDVREAQKQRSPLFSNSKQLLTGRDLQRRADDGFCPKSCTEQLLQYNSKVNSNFERELRLNLISQITLDHT